MDVAQVALSLDVVAFALFEQSLHLLLMQRADAPFAHCWALPGGVVGADERLDDAARRTLAERTGVREVYLEQLYAFGDPGRDPRGRTISVAYYTLLPLGEHPAVAGRGALAVSWHALDALPDLAFDHAEIVAYARSRLIQTLGATPL